MDYSKCDKCGAEFADEDDGHYTKDGRHYDQEPAGRVCDDCYEEITEELTSAQVRRYFD